ncbi:helix-turn-helix transcriptional regulator [Streptomyces sp. x-80]|uniref:helix-turn-helix transcriptional regulator n=1 Tax=Streptomyces sp. x-80 TaxID=2789282 RepID=UPI00397FDD4D
MPTKSQFAPSAVPDPASVVRSCFLNVKDAAAYLGVSPHTLYVWRHRREGPPSFRMGPVVASCIGGQLSTPGFMSRNEQIPAPTQR